MLVFLDRWFSMLAGEIDTHLILPVLYHLGWMDWEELSFDWALVGVYGLFAVIVTYAVCWPLEVFFPIERWENRKAVVIDAFYTIFNRVGVLPVFSFLLFYQVRVYGFVIAHGYIPPTLETLIPPLLGHPVITFIAYALILDCTDYWRHRLSHSSRSAYALHALHHAQRQMSFWSDDRNHVLDELVAGVWFGAVGLAIGIPPLQFPLLFLIMRFIESLSHANIKLSFGWLGDRLIVSPRFHRLHHGLRAAGRNSCNYGAVFPIWDIVFRTANFSDEYPPTGDRRAPESMATGGYLAQQLGGFQFFLEEWRQAAKAARSQS
ncbi:sterol desaturase/sphingolipid hydroxylase (fatty acid hydroxylase superfamily) [Paraburkholderia sp. RAU2J]|nr:sterol desaturase/sphingolipid hydroxylase (fatty acid hydroxylase superfamily) [Paraburkholderia sp. RAU2J]